MTPVDALEMLGQWEKLAQSLQGGYEFGLDDYLNDVDVRQQLETIVLEDRQPADAAFGSRLAAADATMRAATVATENCIWGAANAMEHGWTRDRNWWYFAVPRQRGAEFDADLGRGQG